MGFLRFVLHFFANPSALPVLLSLAIRFAVPSALCFAISKARFAAAGKPVLPKVNSEDA